MQSVTPAETFNILKVSNTTATVTLTNAVTVAGTTTVNANAILATSATLTTTGTATISGTLQLNNGGSVSAAPTYSSGTLAYVSATNGQTFTAGNEWPSSSSPTNVIVNLSGTTAPTVTMAAGRTVSGDLILTAGTLADGGFTISLGGNIAGTGTHTGAGKISMTGSGKTISGATLQNLEIAPGSSNTITLAAGSTVNGNLTLTSGTLADGGFTLSLGGNIAGTGTHTGAGKISMTGSGKTISGATLQNLEINSAGSITLSNGVTTTINGALTLTAGSLSWGTNGGTTLTLAGTVSVGAGSINAQSNNATSNSIVNCTGSALTLPASMFSSSAVHNLIINSAGTVTLGASLNVYGAFTPTAGIFSTGSNTLTFQRVTTAATIGTIGTGSITCTSGSIVWKGPASIPNNLFTSNTTGNLTINNTNSNVTLGGGLTVSGSLVTTTGLDINGQSLTLNGGTVTATTAMIANGTNSTVVISTSGPASIGTAWFTSTNAVTNFTVNRASGFTFGNATSVNGALTLSAGSIAATTLTLGNGATIVRTAGNIGSGTPIFGTAVNVTYNGSGGVTSGNELPSSGSFGILTVNSAGTYTLATSITPTVTGIALTAGTLADAGNTITNTGNITNTGTHSGSGEIKMTGSGATISGATLGNLEIAPGISNTITLAAAPSLNGNLILTAGTLADGGFTISLGGNIAGTGTHTGVGKISMTGSAKTISGATLQNLEINSAGSITLSNGVTTTINGALTLTAGTLSWGANGGTTLTLAGTVSRNGTTQTGTINAQSNNATINSIVNCIGSVLTLPAGMFSSSAVHNLTINSTGTVTLGAGLNVYGAFTPTAGIFSTGSNTLTFQRATTAATIGTIGTGSVTCTSGSIVWMSPASIPNNLFTSNTTGNLTINNTNSNVTLGGGLTVSGTLTLTMGSITLGSNNLTVTTSPIIGCSSSKYIITNSTGALAQSVPVSATDIVYPVGPSSSNYNPITLNNAASSGGTQTYSVSVASGAPSNTANASIYYVQDSWTITGGFSSGSALIITPQWSLSDEGGTYTRGTGNYIGLYNGGFTSNAATASGSNPYTAVNSTTFVNNVTGGVACIVGNFPATVSVASTGSGLASSPVVANATNQAILGFATAINTGTSNFTQLILSATTGNFNSFSALRLVSSPTAAYSHAAVTTVATVSSPRGTSATFNGFSQSVTTSNAYYFIEADVASGVTSGTMGITPQVTSSNVTVSGGALTSGTVTGTDYAFVAFGALDHFTVSSISSPQIAGTNFTATITALDFYNNTVTSFTSTAEMTASTGSVSPATTAAFTAGVLSAANFYVTTTGTSITITATASTKTYR